MFLLRQDNPETVLSIEKFDDIAFETNGEASELLQTKHHVNHTGSLTDSSVDLWKTLRVWTTAIRSGFFDPNSTNLLSLITTGQAPNASAASFLRGNSQRDEIKALDLILAAGQIQDKLCEEHGITASRSTIFSFVKVRSKRRKFYAMAEGMAPVSPTSARHASDAIEALRRKPIPKPEKKIFEFDENKPLTLIPK